MTFDGTQIFLRFNFSWLGANSKIIDFSFYFSLSLSNLIHFIKKFLIVFLPPTHNLLIILDKLPSGVLKRLVRFFQ